MVAHIFSTVLQCVFEMSNILGVCFFFFSSETVKRNDLQLGELQEHFNGTAICLGCKRVYLDNVDIQAIFSLLFDR